MSAGARLMRYYVLPEEEQDETASQQQAPQQQHQQDDQVSPGTATQTGASTAHAGDDAIFAGPVSEIKRDVLYDLGTRYSNAQILAKIKQYHPNGKYTPGFVTDQIAYSMRIRAEATGQTPVAVRDQFNAEREANGVQYFKRSKKQ